MIVKKLPFSEFKSIYSRVPRLCVEIMVKTNNGVLLLKRNIDPEKGKWHLPGGTVLKGERLEDTVKRVAME
ncbi:MAG: NUDIX domain-containing protein, partial [Patescibacteria group bacterium]